MTLHEFDEALEAFDREILRNEHGAREVLIEAGILVPIAPPRRPAYGGAQEAERLRAIHSQEPAP